MTNTPLGDTLLGETSTLGAKIIGILEGFTPPGDFVASEVTDQALVWMELHEPELLLEWAREVARQTLNTYFRQHLRSKRGTWARSARGRAFRDAVDVAALADDSAALEPFSLSYVVNKESLRRRVADMTADDHFFVATQYEKSSDRILLLAAFHRAIAKKIPQGQKTADVMDEETYSRIYASIVK